LAKPAEIVLRYCRYGFLRPFGALVNDGEKLGFLVFRRLGFTVQPVAADVQNGEALRESRRDFPAYESFPLAWRNFAAMPQAAAELKPCFGALGADIAGRGGRDDTRRLPAGKPKYAGRNGQYDDFAKRNEHP
jgi:hypothetical protein